VEIYQTMGIERGTDKVILTKKDREIVSEFQDILDNNKDQIVVKKLNGILFICFQDKDGVHPFARMLRDGEFQSSTIRFENVVDSKPWYAFWR
jgi:hypothetical protein